MNHLSRKDFIRGSLLTGASALFSRPAAAIAPGGSPNGDIRIAVVGIRNRGRDHIKEFPKIPGVRVVALCDVDSRILAKGVAEFTSRNEKVAAYTDCRKLLEDPTIDAISIATPDHWHSLLTVWACQAGKDVYVEKPVSHNVWEGRQAVEAARKYGRIVQAGTQSRSDEALREAFAYLHGGELGGIQWARGLCYKLRLSLGKTSGPQPVPASLDYDLWTGPAPLVPPRRNTPLNGTINYDWHWIWNYGAGDLADQGIHELDMCRWALGQTGLPPTVRSIGGRFGYDDDGETPNTQITVFDYKPAPLIFEVRGLPHQPGMKAMDAYRGIRIGIVVQCENGYFAGGAGGGAIHDNQGKKLKEFSGPGGVGHFANFISAMRSRKASELAAPIECGHISSAICHLGNISHRLGRAQSAASIGEAVSGHQPTRDSFARMLDHLKANGIGSDAVTPILGPQLELVPDREALVTKENYDAGYWANTMLRGAYRKPYVIPNEV